MPEVHVERIRGPWGLLHWGNRFLVVGHTGKERRLYSEADYYVNDREPCWQTMGHWRGYSREDALAYIRELEEVFGLEAER